MANILAFGGSNSSTSINKQLANYTASLFEGSKVNLLDLNDFEMPIFGVDKEKANGFPEEANLFLNHIKACDLIVVSLAEHNGSYSTVFKNLLDWTSRIDGKVFQNKAMILMATSPGARGGISVLEAAKTRFPFHAANIIGSFSLPEFNKNFDQDSGILNIELKEELSKIVSETKTYLQNI